MLDSSIVSQLKDVFKNIAEDVTLEYFSTNHAKQNELVEMLNSVASTSDKISALELDQESNIPSFYVSTETISKRIKFSGIPGGHEFSSLVLAILNITGLGKLPDEYILNKMRSLAGGNAHLKTYISLSCENCPEVVQALNLLAIYNESFTHEMADGEFFQSEIEKLKIQGVPSVVANDEKVVSVGKQSLTSLMESLEENFGVDESSQANQKIVDKGLYDVAIVGSGPAGFSAAIYAARKGLKTILIGEKIGGQVQDTVGIENLISVPYIEGPQLSNKLLEHSKDYDIELLEHRRVDKIDKLKGQHKLYFNTKEELTSKSVIIATGAKWRKLGIDGEVEYTGKGVAYCPHCDGPMFKGKSVAVVGGGNSGVEAAIDLAKIVKDVTLIEFMPELKADKVLVDKLEKLPNVKILKNTKTSRVIGDGAKVTSIELEDRSTNKLQELDLSGVFVQIGLMPNSNFLKDVVELNKFGEVIVDQKGKTSVDGIYAAGDVTTTPFKQIIIAMGEGAKAALSAAESLM